MRLGRAGFPLFAMLILLSACGKDGSSAAKDDAGSSGSDGGTADAGQAPSESEAGAGGDAQVDEDAGSQLIPCGDVTTSGRCASDTRVELCAVQTGGQTPPHLEGYDCELGQVCDDSDGVARCLSNAACTGEETRCSGENTLQNCVAGDWVDAPCATRCVDGVLGAACAPDLDTQTVTGSVEYELRSANVDLTNWTDAPTSVAAKRFSVLSLRGDMLIDATVSDEDGAFSVLAPSTPSPEDKLVVLCAGEDAQGRLAYAVADAGYAASADMLREPFNSPPSPRLWSFSLPLVDFVSGDVISIPESAGSAAARVFEILTGIFNDSQAHYAPKTTQSVIVWVSPGTAWTCGACMTPLPTVVAGQAFLHQVWLDGSAEDEGYWSDAVSAHELGHYVMAGFGYPPAEGGVHYTGYPTSPGQAWSEGWATFYSSVHRDTGLYYDKQGSTFFWFDLDARSYSLDDLPWQRPVAANGLDQLVDENEVAAMLRKTSLTIGDAGPILDALRSPRMRTPPFERGYTLRTWSDPDHPEDFEPTDESIPYLPDFFDALRCSAAISAEELDLVTEPSVHYPYPSASPLCR